MTSEKYWSDIAGESVCADQFLPVGFLLGKIEKTEMDKNALSANVIKSVATFLHESVAQQNSSKLL